MAMLCYFLLFFFFFQAEDGIRDRNVTGVQTCALPIFAQLMAPAKFLQFFNHAADVSFWPVFNWNQHRNRDAVLGDGNPLASGRALQQAREMSLRLVGTNRVLHNVSLDQSKTNIIPGSKARNSCSGKKLSASRDQRPSVRSWARSRAFSIARRV